MQQIIAMGGGGFSMEPDNLALDQYIVAQTGKITPSVCFLSQAGGENQDYIIRFYKSFNGLGCRPSHLSLFQPHTADLEGFLMTQDVVYVGGGNTKSMLALWREWKLDHILRNVSNHGTVLAGVSAGAICWFEQGLTDSVPGSLTPLPCLGYLRGSCTPHYDGEPLRRPSLLAMVNNRTMQAGYAFDDGAAGHFVDGILKTCVSSRPNAKAYWVERVNGSAQETPLPTAYIG